MQLTHRCMIGTCAVADLGGETGSHLGEGKTVVPCDLQERSNDGLLMALQSSQHVTAYDTSGWLSQLDTSVCDCAEAVDYG